MCFEFLVSCFDDFVDDKESYFFELFSEMVMNDFVQFPDTFSQFREEMILYTIVRSSRNTFSNANPFISHIIM